MSKCETCNWYFGETATQGACRFNPPTVVLLPQQQQQMQPGGLLVNTGVSIIPTGMFPPVAANAFCSKWEYKKG